MQFIKYAILLVAIIGMIGLASAGRCKQYKTQMECRQCCWNLGKEYRSALQQLALGCYCTGSLPANVMVD